MILTDADLIAAALNELSPELRRILTARFLEEESLWALMRRHRMTKKEVEACVATALEQMKTYMGIPAKLNSIPEGSRTPFRAEGEHHWSEATLAF